MGTAGASSRRDEWTRFLLAGLVGVHRDRVDPGVLAVADRPRLANTAAARVDAVARSGRFSGGAHRCTHPRWPHRIPPPRKPLRMAVAWLWAGPHSSAAGGLYAAYALVVEPGSLPAPRTISRVIELGGPLALTFAPFLLLLFPTGRLPSPRWRPLAWISTFSGVVLLVLNFLFARPETVGGVITAVTVSVVAVIFAAFALSALSLVVRYRRASGLERQQ